MSGGESPCRLEWEARRRMAAGKKSGKTEGCKMNSIVAGIDLGDRESLATVLSPIGDVADRFTFPMNEEGYAFFASRVPKDAKVAFESTIMAYPISRALVQLGYDDITVAHPKTLAWIVRSKKKNDRVDSLKIAKLHMAGMLPESHLLDRDQQVVRDLLVQRVKLGVEIGRLKNSVIGYLKREGVYDSLPQTGDNFSIKRRRAIRSLRFHDKRDLVLGTMMDRLHFLEKQCTPLEDSVRENARMSDDVKILMTITGVDYYLASLLSSFIGDVERFPSDDHLASFFGIVPTSRDSADVKRRGKMTKDGSSIARWTLSIMVDTVMHHNEPIREYYASVKKRTGSGKLAHVSTMRKLTRMLYHMLKTREHWKWENPLLTERKMARLELGGGDGS
jgi:transposase